MKKVYFYLKYVTLCTRNNEYIVDAECGRCRDYGVVESPYYDTIEEAFESKEAHDFSYSSPIMEGWIKE